MKPQQQQRRRRPGLLVVVVVGLVAWWAVVAGEPDPAFDFNRFKQRDEDKCYDNAGKPQVREPARAPVFFPDSRLL